MKLPQKPPNEDNFFHRLNTADTVSIKELKPFLDLANSEYLHWDELRHDDRFKNLDLNLLWNYLRFTRESNFRHIAMGSVPLNYCQTPLIEKMLHDVDFKAGGKIGLPGQLPELTLQKKYLVNSLMEEAIASSQLEGAVTSRLVAKQMLLEKRKPRTSSEKMIVNNYRTMNYIREKTRQNDRLTPDIIKEIHRQISKDTLDKPEDEGVFRTNNEIKVYSTDDFSEPIYSPPDFNKIEEMITHVCDFANNESKEYYLHPIVKAIVLHFMMGYIHPFCDGNGRTGRALFYWYLISQGYDYFEYLSVSKVIKEAPAQYARAYLFTESDGDDLTYFVVFNLRCLDRAVSLFENYVEKTREQNNKILETIRQNDRLNLRQADLLMVLSKNLKPITIKEVTERYKVTYETARTDLLNLVNEGYLESLKRGKQHLFLPSKQRLLS